MISLPEPAVLASLVLRTDFSDGRAWAALKTAVDGFDTHRATFVSDRVYAGVSVQVLVDADVAADDSDKLTYLVLADATTMTDQELRLLAVDLYTKPSRTFRVPPRGRPPRRQSSSGGQPRPDRTA